MQFLVMSFIDHIQIHRT